GSSRTPGWRGCRSPRPYPVRSPGRWRGPPGPGPGWRAAPAPPAGRCSADGGAAARLHGNASWILPLSLGVVLGGQAPCARRGRIWMSGDSVVKRKTQNRSIQEGCSANTLPGCCCATWISACAPQLLENQQDSRYVRGGVRAFPGWTGNGRWMSRRGIGQDSFCPGLGDMLTTLTWLSPPRSEERRVGKQVWCQGGRYDV